MLARQPHHFDTADGFRLADDALDILDFGDIHLTGMLRLEEPVHRVGQRADGGTLADPFLIEAHQEIHVSADIVIEHRDVAAGHVRNRHVVLVLHELPENATHRNHIVVGVRGEAQGFHVPWELALPADFRAKHVEHQAVHGTGRAVSRHQRRHRMLVVVVLRQLEDRLVAAPRKPRHRAHREGVVPADVIDQPRRGHPRKICGSGVVHIERRVRMTLEERRGHGAIDFTLQRPAHDARLVFARRQNRDLTGLQDRRNAHRDRFAWHVVFAEEIRSRVAPSDRIEMHDARSALLAGARFVEADMSGLADAEQLKVHAARR